MVIDGGEIVSVEWGTFRSRKWYEVPVGLRVLLWVCTVVIERAVRHEKELLGGEKALRVIHDALSLRTADYGVALKPPSTTSRCPVT